MNMWFDYYFKIPISQLYLKFGVCTGLVNNEWLDIFVCHHISD
jgi:hypothetical protein